MAAFAALASLKQTIHHLQNHPSPPISINKHQVESLTQTATFLLEFLQGYNPHIANNEEPDPLEIRIADAAYAAEDLIESEIVDRIHIRSTVIGKLIGIFKFSRSLGKCTCLEDDLYQDLQLVIEAMDLIKEAAMAIRTDSTEVRPQLRKHVSIAVGSSTSSSSSASSSSSMVGFDDALNEVLENVVGTKLDLQVIPITGMGGIGKTTLARNLFNNAYIKEEFVIRAWTTISQDYNAPQALKELLNQSKGNSSGKSEDELGKELYQYLMTRRYLIVMDDMWSIEVWDKIRHYFPNYKNRSRIIITTRLSNLASLFNISFNMKFLDEVSSWNLFSKTVFGEESFPLELKEIGENIVAKFRGLPLSIVATGGLLKKSEKTRDYWKYIEQNLNSIVNSEGDEYCLRVLKMSYNHLPVHLKPCFLYLSVFKEDHPIRVSALIKQWVSEGFLQATSEKTLETVGEENFKELIGRNLILADGLGSTGNIRHCKIHDLLRDLCVREAQKERFCCFVPEQSPRGISSMRRVVIHGSTWEEPVLQALQSMPHARSFMCFDNLEDERYKMAIKLPLLRTLRTYKKDRYSSRNRYSLRYVFQLVNLRHIAIEVKEGFWTSIFPQISEFLMPEFPPSLNHLWNLQTLIVRHLINVTAPIEIWNMPLLRHVKFDFRVCLPDPPATNVVIMENLQTLKTVVNLKLDQEMVKRIPNIKKLYLWYEVIESNLDDYRLDSLECLHKLESFRCHSLHKAYDFLKKLAFPESLKKLSLGFTRKFKLEELLEKIGSLPLLQRLDLSGGSFRTRHWVTIEGQFRKLELLSLEMLGGLEQWTSESSHFPRLKKIYLEDLMELKEIPSEIGDLPNIREIVLKRCSVPAVTSAKKIVEEQEDLQGEDELPFHIRVIARKRKTELKKVRCTESTGQCAGRRRPHFHRRRVIVNQEEQNLKKLAGPNFRMSFDLVYY